MASGIQIGSSFRLTSPIPTLVNAVFLNAAGRLAAGQLRNTAWDYHQQDTATYWRIKPQAACFLANGTTAVTQAGTWGTLEAHWTPGSGGVGTQGPIGPAGPAGAASTVPGPTGPNGNRILSVNAVPVLSDGNLTDLAIVSSTGDLYEKTSSGWALRGNLKGPAGATGTGGTGTSTTGVSSFNSRTGSVILTAADVLAVVSRANQLAGGLHSAPNKAAMNATPESLRDYGMTVVVYADPILANNGRYDLALDLITFIKQGSDVASQFLPYNAAVMYNSASAYVTYPDPVTNALRIFHSLASGAATVQPAPVNASNVLNAAWEEISPSAVAVRVPLYTVTGQNTDGAMTQKATSDQLSTANGKIAILQAAIKIGTNVGNGEQAGISVGGFANSVTGLESGSVGGGAIVIPGNDSGSVGGSLINISGTNSGQIGSTQGSVAGNTSVLLGTFGCANPAETSAVIASRGAATDVTSKYVAVIGVFGGGTMPAISEGVITSQVYVVKAGGGFSLASPDGLQRKALTLDNAGGLTLAGTTVSDSFAALPYGTGSVILDFNAATVQTLAATGNLAFSTANVALLKTKELFIKNDTGTAITISGPAGWTFFPGPYPTSLAAGKQAVLTLRSLGTSDLTIKAAYVAQA